LSISNFKNKTSFTNSKRLDLKSMVSGSYIIRNYAPDDFEKYLRLHVESEQLEPSGRFVSARDLSDHLGRPNFTPQKDLFIAEFNGKFIGYISITLEPGIQRALLEGLVHPRYRRKEIATQLFSGALKRVRQSGIPSVQVSVSETNSAAKDLLIHLGFTFIRYFFKMRLDISSVRLPAANQGPMTSRKLRPGEDELLTQIQNRCFADTWGFNPNTTAEITYRLQMHGRSPEDVILTYMDDTPVGYCWSIINAEEKAKREKSKGMIHMLGVDPDYRQQEIGKAILLSGLEDLKARAVDIVDLTVDSENPAACSLYESVGFEVYAKTEWYEKIVL
jgi:mycothiol synthase